MESFAHYQRGRERGKRKGTCVLQLIFTPCKPLFYIHVCNVSSHCFCATCLRICDGSMSGWSLPFCCLGKLVGQKRFRRISNDFETNNLSNSLTLTTTVLMFWLQTALVAPLACVHRASAPRHCVSSSNHVLKCAGICSFFLYNFRNCTVLFITDVWGCVFPSQ